MKLNIIKSIILSCVLVLALSTSALAIDRDPDTWVPDSGFVSAQDGTVYPGTVFLYCDFEWSS